MSPKHWDSQMGTWRKMMKNEQSRSQQQLKHIENHWDITKTLGFPDGNVEKNERSRSQQQLKHIENHWDTTKMLFFSRLPGVRNQWRNQWHQSWTSCHKASASHWPESMKCTPHWCWCLAQRSLSFMQGSSGKSQGYDNLGDFEVK